MLSLRCVFIAGMLIRQQTFAVMEVPFYTATPTALKFISILLNESTLHLHLNVYKQIKILYICKYN